MGLGHPNPAVPEMEMERRAIVLAGELGLTDRVVFFNNGWVPYEERGAYFVEADLGVSAHFDDLETRLAFRTRLLDCIWAALPIVTTGGDALGEMVDRRGLGRAVAAEDVDGWVGALGRLLDDDDERNAIRAQSIAVRSEFVWPRVVAPLRRLVTSTRAQPGSARARTLVRYAFDRVHNAVLQRGLTAAGTAAMRRLTRTTPPLEKRVQPPLPPLP
jgi:glycosyltransferase involved in cell wall biosynthesis